MEMTFLNKLVERKDFCMISYRYLRDVDNAKMLYENYGSDFSFPEAKG